MLLNNLVYEVIFGTWHARTRTTRQPDHHCHSQDLALGRGLLPVPVAGIWPDRSAIGNTARAAESNGGNSFANRGMDEHQSGHCSRDPQAVARTKADPSQPRPG